MQNLIDKFPYNQEVKNLLKDTIGKIVLPKSVYYNYPTIFLDYFENIDKNEIDKLCTASFYMYMYTTLTDNFFDKKELSNKDISDFNLAHIFHDEALKILIKLFSGNINFWSIWNIRRLNFLSINVKYMTKSKTSCFPKT